MIERKFVSANLKEYQIEEYLRSILGRAGLSYIKIQKTPLGEKVIICSSRPGLVVGKSGSNISRLTKDLKERFGLENPQIELVEAENPFTDAAIVAEGITNSLERFGTARFKGIGHKAMDTVTKAGARGVEILISGKIPSSRAKKWRFYVGYIKKSGDIAVSGIDKAYSVAKLKTGVVGIQVRIMPASTKLPDDMEYILEATLEDGSTGKKEILKTEQAEEKTEVKEKKPAKKRAKKPKSEETDKKEKKPRKKATKNKE